MNRKILLTGAFGNVGQNTLKQLMTRDHEVTCFELQNKANEKTRQELLKQGEFETIWGDILEKSDVNRAVKEVDCIIHLAAIIPPLSERKPELAQKVNVEGTRNLISAAQKSPNKPRFIMASSVSVYGITMDSEPPVRKDTPLNPVNNYAQTKVECEKMVRESDLPWMILRLGAVSVEEFQVEFDPILFEMPLDQRIEFVSSIDCGIAFSNAVTLDNVNDIFLIGGGDGCQLLEREFLKGLFDAFGLKMLPEGAFKKPTKREDWFYIDWMDTDESQRALSYQTETFLEYIERIKREFRWKRFGVKLVAPIAKWYLLRQSPYYNNK
jgi:nucleoside-diphosphate-sugar epimerase